MTIEQAVQAPLALTARSIAARLRNAGFKALFAGGFVRDAILGLESSDIDIATDAVPAEVMRLFPRHAAVGASFGVVMVIEDGTPFEVATFRNDDVYLDGRRPSKVSFSSPEEDAARRDFTINGLFMDPADGRIIDYVGGLDDLRRGIIRTIGRPEDRFQEDHLRLLRAVRFAVRFGFALAAETLAAIPPLASTLHRISAERVREELLKMLTARGAGQALTLMRDLGVLEAILPEAAAMSGVRQPEAFHPEGDVFTHTALMLDLANHPISPELAMGILLHDVGKPATYHEAPDRIRFHGHAERGAEIAAAVLARLKFSRAAAEAVVSLVRGHLRFIDVQEMRPSTLKRFLRTNDFPTHLELHRLDCLASHQDLSHYHFCQAQFSALGEEALRPPPLLSGDDLIALGLRPGPVFRVILAELEDLQLEGTITSREEAKAYVLTRSEGGKTP